jgi:predicted site-specific integrase-resolvase
MESFKSNEYDPSSYLSLNQVIELLKISRITLNRYVNDKVIRDYKISSKKILYNRDDVYRMLNIKPSDMGINVMYTRVSKTTQLNQLKEQQSLISTFAIRNGIKIDKIYSDMCRSYYFKQPHRRGMFELLKDVTQYKVKKIYIMSPDRVTRFGHEIFDEICKFFKVDVIYISNEIMDKDSKDDVRDEVITILKSIKETYAL